MARDCAVISSGPAAWRAFRCHSTRPAARGAAGFPLNIDLILPSARRCKRRVQRFASPSVFIISTKTALRANHRFANRVGDVTFLVDLTGEQFRFETRLRRHTSFCRPRYLQPEKITGREESRVPRGSCVEEATRASASRKNQKDVLGHPCTRVLSAPADVPAAGLAFCRLRSHQTMAPTARARSRKIQRRKTHRLGPCKFSQRPPNHANMATKNQPDTANEVLPGELHQSSIISRKAASARTLESLAE